MPTTHVQAAPKSSSLPPGALKLPDAAKYLGGIHPLTLRKLVDRGLIKPNRATRHLLFPVSELDRFLASGGEAVPVTVKKGAARR